MLFLTWGSWNPRPAEVSFVAGPSCPPWLSLGPLQACQSWEAWGGGTRVLKWD